MENCLFCKIARGEIPSAKVFENEWVYAFRDIHPQAPTHVLVIPKKHVSSVSESGELSDSEIAALFQAIRQIAADENLKDGYRVISNCGPDACLTVPHLHFHVLGGRKMSDQMA